MSPLRRLPILFVLVPQLLVLGMVTGACFCIDSDGDTHLRAAAETCCQDGEPARAVPGTGVSVTSEGEDCGTCRDVTLAVDMGSPWSPDRWEQLGKSLAGMQAPVALAPRVQAPRLRAPVAFSALPPAAAWLHSVVMIC